MKQAQVTTYRLYGRTCASRLPLPELVEAEPGPCDFIVDMARLAIPRSLIWSDQALDERGEEFAAIGEQDGILWFRFFGEGLFAARTTEHRSVEILVESATAVPTETIRHLLVDHVVPMLLAASGSIVLHGAAVSTRHGALVILGDSGAGKSTLAASFGLSGTAILSDDCVVVDGAARSRMVQPGYPSVRVWETSAGHLFGPSAPGAPFAHYTEKRRYCRGLLFARNSAPLIGVVQLARTEARYPAPIAIAELRGHAAGAALLRNAKSMPLGARKAATVRALLELASEVPLGSLELPDDLARLDAAQVVLNAWADAL